VSGIDNALPDDAEHLRLLSIFHFVVGGLTALVACIPLIHLAVGIAIVSGAFDDVAKGSPPPAFIGWLFIVIGALVILLGWTYSIGLIVAGRLLGRRQGYLFCLVMAGLSCMNMPLGTCLGVFTIVVLTRPSVKALFRQSGSNRDDFGLE
jgi:hypothetical protein